MGSKNPKGGGQRRWLVLVSFFGEGREGKEKGEPIEREDLLAEGRNRDG